MKSMNADDVRGIGMLDGSGLMGMLSVRPRQGRALKPCLGQLGGRHWGLVMAMMGGG